MNGRQWLAGIAMSLMVVAAVPQSRAATVYFAVAPGSHPHDVAAAPQAGGPVYYTAQATGMLGVLDPATGRDDEIRARRRIGAARRRRGSRWRAVDHRRRAECDPARRPGDACDQALAASRIGGRREPQHADVRSSRPVWFTGQSGFYGRLDPASGDVSVWRAPRGAGPYGMTTTPSGDVYYASLAGNHIARIDVETGEATIIEPPTREQGARRVWADSKGGVWVSCWNTGQVARYDPATRSWREWALPGRAHAYAVWVDPEDRVWLSDWSANAIVRFDPATERFTRYPSDRAHANVREMQGRRNEAWGAESGTDRLVRIDAH